jgi:hypothetical protein
MPSQTFRTQCRPNLGGNGFVIDNNGMGWTASGTMDSSVLYIDTIALLEGDALNAAHGDAIDSANGCASRSFAPAQGQNHSERRRLPWCWRTRGPPAPQRSPASAAVHGGTGGSTPRSCHAAPTRVVSGVTSVPGRSHRS